MGQSLQISHDDAEHPRDVVPNDVAASAKLEQNPQPIARRA